MHILKLLFMALLIVVNLKGQTVDTPKLQSDTYELPDLIVTGLLWDTPVKNVPESVTLFSDTDLKNRHAVHFKDLIGAIPNLTYTGGTNRPRYFQIRGLGENSQFEGETPDMSVRFLIDDFDFTGIGGIASLFDVEQVEVIRGHQSSSYGANASAGIIKISTGKADANNPNQYKLSFGTEKHRAFGFATGGAIGDNGKTNYRMSLSIDKSDGFIKDSKNFDDNRFTLLKIRHNPYPKLETITSFVHANSNNGYDEWSLYNTPLETQSDKQGIDNQRSKGFSIKAINTFDVFDLTLIGSLLSTDSNYSYDSDWGDYSSYGSGYDGYLSTIRDRNSSSVEAVMNSNELFQINSILDKWAFGAKMTKLEEKSQISYDDFFNAYPYLPDGDGYYTEQDYQDSVQSLIDFDNGLNSLIDIQNLDTGDGFSEVESIYKTQTISLFSKAEKTINNQQKLILGLNYEYHKVDFKSDTKKQFYYNYYEENGEFIPADLTYVGQPVLDNGGHVSISDNLFGGSVIFETNLNKEFELFLSYSIGYKAAGANSTSFRESEKSMDTYDTETINNAEFGLTFNNSLKTFRGKINAFYFTRQNTQLRDSNGSGAFFNYFTENSGDAKHYGLEYESNWIISQNWSFQSNVSLLKAKLNSQDRDLSNAPNYQYNFLLNYTHLNGFYANLSLNGSDDYFESNSHNFKRDAFAIVNGSIGYSNQFFDLSFWVKNLFNQDYKKRVFYFDNYHPDDAIYPTPTEDPGVFDMPDDRRKPSDTATNPQKYNREYHISSEPIHYGVTMRIIW